MTCIVAPARNGEEDGGGSGLVGSVGGGGGGRGMGRVSASGVNARERSGSEGMERGWGRIVRVVFLPFFHGGG